MDKIDLKKQLKHLCEARADTVREIDVPMLNFLMIDGRGDPNTTPAYQAAVEALFALSYAIKFLVKKGPTGVDYGVLPLEGLWWADDMSRFTAADRALWHWTMMIMQPECMTASIIEQARRDMTKKISVEVLDRVRFDSMAEGRCAQTLHVGPFTEEGSTIARVHEFIERRGHRLSGKHHEICLSDIRRVDPRKWRTLIRQPMH
jgi:hypothetical protein